ncbi:MAG: penicillin-binding transpeptidase domain-containing protein [Actinomycetaceae bacterium]|nr:penicillin-binding transpeptidase domain-containing protein [Actinomycetaceae bacterium]
MNTQIRRLFLIVVLMFAGLFLAVSNNQFLRAGELNADNRNARTVMHASEVDRGPIIVAGDAIASSELIEGTRRFQRSYPQGPLYAHVTGYFSASFTQATGMEDAADTVLQGDSEALLAQRLKNLFTGSTRQGGGVVLTINPDLQRIAAEQLGNRKGAVVAIDTRTGGILALQSSPSFDPNSLAAPDGEATAQAYEALGADPAKPLANRAIAGDLYAPGSTFKVITTAVMLDKGIATADTQLESPVTTTLPGTNTQVSNIESSECGSGNPTLKEAFARSCNTTFVLAADKLSHEDLADASSKFGFGSTLDIPLPVTPSSFPAETDPAQRAMASIGQYDVRTTPLQMAMVAQAIANKGELLTPYLVAEVVDSDLQTRSSATPVPRGRAVSAETAQTLTDMMRATVDEPYGTANSLQIDGIPVAAKTGTAETGVNGQANAWVMGFAPADDPQIAFAVVVEGDESDPVPHGGTVAGPIARAIVEAGVK